MSLTPHQLERRRNYLGASEIAAVLGRHPYQNAADIYHSKTGTLTAFDGNEATDAGNRLERTILDWAADRLNVTIRANQFRVHENRIHSATLDATINERPTEALEAKTAGLLTPYGASDEWGDELTGEVPEWYALQAQQQMLVAGLERVWIPALLGGRGFVLYRVDRDEEIIQWILEEGERFWREHVLPQVPPADVLPSLDTLKRVEREPGSSTSLPDELLEAYWAAKEAAKAAKEAEDNAKAALIAALGTAEAGEGTLGSVTYFEQSRTSIDTKALKADHPELFEQYARSSSYRVLRDKKAKKASVKAA